MKAIWHEIQFFYYRLRETNWRAFFLTNGPGELINKRFTGFREHCNDFDASGEWIAQITGKNREHRGLALYYASVTVRLKELLLHPSEMDWQSQYLQKKSAEAERHLESFARADCRCRLGFHWKCAVHHNWVG